MDQTHVHLIITHLPIFGSLLGGLVLAYALVRKSNDTMIAAYGLFAISALGAVIAYVTGEAAEESVEHIPGVLHDAIENHEEFAIYALISGIVLGLASIMGIVVTIKKSAFSGKLAVLVLLLSLVCFGLVARTGYLGGQIRHTEITDAAPNASHDADHEHEHDHD